MPTVRSETGMVCSVDRAASAVGVEILRRGGSAVDAAIATNAVLAVTTQHMCGLGGDLFALVHDETGPPAVLNASGRSGAGADAEKLRAQGHSEMIHRGDISSVPVPGCVDGWIALHDRFGRVPFAELLEPAVQLASEGFEASPLLAKVATTVANVANNTELRDISQGSTVKRPGIARTLRAISDSGREGFYGGEFGEALLVMGAGEYSEDDLERVDAEWVEPLGIEAFGHRVWTVPPNSQGYLSLAGAWIAERVGLSVDPADPAWAHVLIESSRAAAFDRTLVLSDQADGPTLISPERLGPRADRIDGTQSVDWGDSYADGGTIYLCATDSTGMGISLIQSNCRDFGSYLVAGDTGIFLHNRGI
ncbi:MAG: gamma-glutamyltransferase, partial [Acidimicrobiales bacterium]